MTDLKSIRVFLEVAAKLNFSAAARALQMTPASVTRIVSKLEDDMGQQLFIRTTRQVSMTTAGAIAATRYRPIVEELDRTTRDITKATRPDMGRLRINAPMSLGARVMPQLVESFRLAYPGIELEVFLTDTLVDIIEGECDLAVRVSEPPTDKSTIWRKICQVPRHVIAAPSLFQRIPKPMIPDDLKPDTLLGYSDQGRSETWKLRKGGQKRDVKTSSKMISNSGDFLYSIAVSGGGICVLPDFIVRPGLESGDVEKLLPDWEVSPLWLTLFYPPYDQFPPLVATFTDFFEAYMREYKGMIF
ncbi:LysR family transcriptional regulator [uncultured Tateyamaria sp.]|uniref:LysR family transcriptional regulator n=1 Tax=uncultured Tateyamaria sp. TaxID=455651 RepID=UPI00260891C9|nr:LysR family transcriptional regulator [uncultured Tateyamaria sp.]